MSLKLIKRGKYYHMHGSVAGVSVRESTRVDNRAAADAIRIRRQTEILERVSLGRRASISFAEAALTYLESGGEGRFLLPILDYFGQDFRLCDVNNEAVNNCARALQPDAAPATINRQIITPISAVVSLAAEDDLCAFRKFRRRSVDNARLRWLTPGEAEALIDAAGEPETALKIAFLLGTGCRVSEALSITRKHMHIDSREAWIAKTKNGSPRMVNFPDRIARALGAHGLPEAGAVFLTRHGKPYSIRANTGGQIKNAFNKARDRAGLGQDVTPHTLRHTWATWYYAQTKDFGGLMDLGGWKQADMANRYRKIAPSSLGEDLFKHGWNFTNEPAPVDRDREAPRVLKL